MNYVFEWGKWPEVTQEETRVYESDSEAARYAEQSGCDYAWCVNTPELPPYGVFTKEK